MLERDLQDLLFENPDILFPGETISRKRREVSIDGRRIDLLFEVGGVHYIVELKRDTIRREDIGQILEYYGLMRQSDRTIPLKMILVAPSIPAYRRIPLEEFGIRCVEVQHPPVLCQDPTPVASTSVRAQRPGRADRLCAPGSIATPQSVSLEDMLPPVTP